jgi:capsular exopolysaccharide synthesis family protein
MADSSSNTVHFHDYLKVLRSRFGVIFIIFALTAGSGWFVTDQILPRIYSATAEVEIRPRGEEAVNSFDGSTTDRPFEQTLFQSEFERMKSPDVLMPIIDDLGLEKKWAQVLTKGKVDQLTPLQALSYMKGTVLDIQFKKGTELIDITANTRDPKEAADIANAVANHYKQVRDAEESERANGGIDTIRDQIAEQQKIVDDRRAKLDALRDEAGKAGVSIEPLTQGTESRADINLDSRNRDLLAAKEEASTMRVLMDSTKNLPDDEFVNTVEAIGGQEIPNIANLRADAFKVEADIDNLEKQGYEENHPRVQALKAELARERQQIADLIAGTRQAIVVKSQMADSRVALLQKEVDELTARTQRDQETEVGPYHDAQVELEHQQSLLDAYNVHLKQVIADSHLMQSPVIIRAPADVPESPSKPNTLLNMAVSVVAGLFLGIMVAFFIEYLDTSVKTMADAESLLGLPVLAVIPNKGGPLPINADSAKVPYAEGYRILRAKLDLKVQNGLGPSISMLSGGPGEGKSTTLYNMAVVCAQAGQSVILVDSDLRRPTVHGLVKVSNERGLANYLRGEGDALDFIQETKLPNLHVLPAGEMSLSEIGTLASEKIRGMLDELKQRYDIVFVDSPPILGVSDGSIIAREVDYVILVIQHRRFPREISLRAKRAVEEVHGNCVGMVLNGVTLRSDDSYYYYNNYRTYYRKTERKKKAAVAKKNGNGRPPVSAARKSAPRSDEF